jgi:hypothetical protein
MRYLMIAVALGLLAGCTTAATNDKSRVFYDRKYNTTYPLRSEPLDTTPARTKATLLYDRKYNTYLPTAADGR